MCTSFSVLCLYREGRMALCKQRALREAMCVASCLGRLRATTLRGGSAGKHLLPGRFALSSLSIQKGREHIHAFTCNTHAPTACASARMLMCRCVRSHVATGRIIYTGATCACSDSVCICSCTQPYWFPYASPAPPLHRSIIIHNKTHELAAIFNPVPQI